MSPLLHTSSWHGAQLIKLTDSFTFIVCDSTDKYVVTYGRFYNNRGMSSLLGNDSQNFKESG
jgi:hypothetical protein